MSSRLFSVLLCLLVAIAIGLRVMVSLLAGPTLESLPDQGEYLQAARSLAQTHTLAVNDPRVNDVVYAYRLPGYPTFIWMLGNTPTNVRLAQACLDGATVIAAALAARTLLSPLLGLIAGALVAVHPFLIYFSATLLSETLFTALLAWAMFLLVHDGFRERIGWRWWLAMALLLLSIYVRPSAIGLPLVLGLAGLLHRPLVLWRMHLPVALTLGVLTLAVMLPWAVRNKTVLRHWIWTSTNSGFTLYDGLNPGATGASDQRFVAEMPQLQTMSEVDRSTYLGSLAWQYAREHPMRTLRLAAVKIARTWSPVPLSEASQRRGIVLASVAFCGPFFVLIAVGMFRRGLPTQIVLLLIAPAVYFTIVHAVSVGSIRYRVPADVPMAIVAAAAFSGRRRQPA